MTNDSDMMTIPTSGRWLGETYDRLREKAPVHRVTVPDGSPVWLVTRPEDVVRGLADPRLSLDRRRHSRGGWSGFALPPALDANLLNMDPPDHTRIRRLVAPAFGPQRTAALRPQIRRQADTLLAGFDGGDLVESYCTPLSVGVISDLLGIPDADRSNFRDWTNTVLATQNADRQAIKQAIVQMHGFIVELINRKRRESVERHEPAGDLLSALVAVEEDGDRLSGDELTSLAFLILFAGYENSANLIANAVLMLLERGTSLGTLTPEQIAGAVDESLRLDPPAPVAIRRFPVEDVTIGGTTIPAGDTVLLAIAAATRSAVSGTREAGGSRAGGRADDGRSEPDRTASGGQLAFGRGPHYCLGATLARVEAEEAIAALGQHLPNLALAVPVDQIEWRPSFRTHGPAALPVTH